MDLSLERIVHIMACMYGNKAEAVIDISNEECYLYLGSRQHEIEIYYEEIECLIYNDIIEIDSGCEEKGHETEVYRLTDEAQVRIKAIIENKKLLLLKK